MHLPSEASLLEYVEKNVDVLEDELHNAGEQWRQLRRRGKDLCFGQYCTHARLMEIAPEAFSQVRTILNIHQVGTVHLDIFSIRRAIQNVFIAGMGTSTLYGVAGAYDMFQDNLTAAEVGVGATICGTVAGIIALIASPKRKRGGHYDYRKRLIRIGLHREAVIPEITAHEYTHHIQKEHLKMTPIERASPLIEGPARLVGGIVARNFAERTNNPAHVYHYVRRVAKELTNAYVQLCRRKRMKPKKNLLREQTYLNLLLGFNEKGFGNYYDTGTAVMKIATAKNGQHILEQVTKNDFSFLEK